MKAVSLWQPWATAIAIGSKRIETRSWPTSYRGPLAIHAAKRCVIDEMLEFSCSWTWCGALRKIGLQMGGEKMLDELLPFGAIVAVCRLVDCRPTDSFTQGELDRVRMPDGETLEIYGWTERMMGDFSLGRFGWVLDDVKPLASPIPYAARQNVFEVDASVFGV
jgi:hypothetical protein